jgi:LAGLIDADG endonuclease
MSKKVSSKIGWTVEPVFSIRLHDKDLATLKLIQAYFEGIGKIYHHDQISEATFRVGSLNELDVIIRHFLKYPLITQKYSDFILFKQVIDLIKNKEHLTLQGVLKIANIKASMNTKQETPDIPDIVPVLRPSLPIDAHINLNPYWISGFTAGEGCFSVSVIKSKAKLGETSWIRFILTQHNRDKNLMNSLVTYFGCGKINQASAATYFVVQRLSDIMDIIIPFFDKYPLVGVKVKDFEDFKRVGEIMNSKGHLTKEGLEAIRKIKQGMNTMRK